MTKKKQNLILIYYSNHIQHVILYECQRVSYLAMQAAFPNRTTKIPLAFAALYTPIMICSSLVFSLKYLRASGSMPGKQCFANALHYSRSEYCLQTNTMQSADFNMHHITYLLINGNGLHNYSFTMNENKNCC